MCAGNPPPTLLPSPKQFSPLWCHKASILAGGCRQRAKCFLFVEFWIINPKVVPLESTMKDLIMSFTVSHRITLLLHLSFQQFRILQRIQLQDLQTPLIILWLVVSIHRQYSSGTILIHSVTAVSKATVRSHRWRVRVLKLQSVCSPLLFSPRLWATGFVYGHPGSLWSQGVSRQLGPSFK